MSRGLGDVYKRQEQPTATLPDVGVESPPPGALDTDPELADAMAQLTPRQQTLLVLRHVVGLDGEETAAVVGSNRTAVYAATARAERRLRNLLAVSEEGR